MSLGEHLVEDLRRAMTATADGAPRDVVLWFDAMGEWRRPVSTVHAQLASAGLDIITLESTGSQLATKFRLLSRADSARAVVYLPGWTPRDLQPDGDTRPRLWSIAEFAFTGAFWAGNPGIRDGPEIADWLERHGVRVAGGAAARKRLTTGSSDSKLSRWLARVLDRDAKDLPEPLRESDVAAMLGGEPQAAVVELLLDPDRAFRSWADDAGDVLDCIRDRYGLSIAAGLPPEGVADSIAADLALVEAWDAFGRPEDFPFASRLPVGDAKRSDAVIFVRRDLLARGDVARELLRRLSAHELSFDGLISWGAGRTGTPMAMPHVAHARWLRTIEQLVASAKDGWQGVLAAPLGSEPEPGLAPDLPSIPGVPSTSWTGLRRMRTLVKAASDAIDAVPAYSIAQLVDAYIGGWWRIDDDYIGFRREADQHPSLSPLRHVVDRAYGEYLEASAGRWTRLIENDASWTSALPSVRDVTLDLWAAKDGPRATLVIDAVRWDIARALEQRIGPGCRLQPILSTLPSTTPFGMSALLPLDSTPAVSVGAKGVSLHVGKHEISSREGRISFLKEWFGGQGRTVAFLELDDILRGAKIPAVDQVVVFNYALDQVGHAPATSANLPTEVEASVARIDLAVRQLHRAKIRHIDIVTDHGFLYVEPSEIDSLGRPKVIAANALNRGPRYVLLKSDAPAPDLIRIQVPLAPGNFVGLPRGIRTLVQAELYEHGGVSLQECVLPHLISEFAVAPETLEVQVTASTTRLSGATVAFSVGPAGTNAQMSLGAPTRRRLKLWLEVVGLDGERSEVSEPLECEVRSDSPELRQALYLRDDRPLPAGTTILLRARDMDTRADLSEVALKLLVDWG